MTIAYRRLPVPGIPKLGPRGFALVAVALAGAAAPMAWGQSAPSTAMLRLACDGPALSAEVTINDEFKGDCPIDVPVAAGNLRIRVTKKVDAERELVFEQEVRMVGGTVKRIDVEFGAPRLNAAAQRVATQRGQEAKAEAERIAAVRQAQAAAAESRAAEEAGRVRVAAEAGNEAAMAEMGNRHAAGGQGVPKSDAEALLWYRRAAAAGNQPAAALLASGVPVPESYRWILRRMAVQPLNTRRVVDVSGADAIRGLIASDAFFEAEGGNATVNYRLQRSELISDDMTCRRDGRQFQVKGVQTHRWPTNLGSDNYDITQTAILGGLVAVDAKRSRFFDRSHGVVNRIGWIQGQPFPLAPGSQFAISYEMQTADEKSSMVYFLACMADPATSEAPAQAKPDSVQMTCYRRLSLSGGGIGTLFRARWQASSSCVVPSADAWSSYN